LGGEAELRNDAQLGGDEDGARRADVVVEDVFDKDEGSSTDKLDDREEERVADDDDGFGMDSEPPVRKIGPVLDIGGKQ